MKTREGGEEMKTQDASLAKSWLDKVFPFCDALEREKFEANFARAEKGEEIVDDWGVSRLSGAGEAYQAQYVLCELAKDAKLRGAALPTPEEPEGTLWEYASRFGEDSAVAKVLSEAASRIGWDCEAFNGFDVSASAFERAARFSLVALAVKEREERKAAVLQHQGIGDAYATFFSMPARFLALALYCVNRVALCKRLRLCEVVNLNVELLLAELATLYRRLYRLGGFQK